VKANKKGVQAGKRGTKGVKKKKKEKTNDRVQQRKGETNVLEGQGERREVRSMGEWAEFAPQKGEKKRGRGKEKEGGGGGGGEKIVERKVRGISTRRVRNITPAARERKGIQLRRKIKNGKKPIHFLGSRRACREEKRNAKRNKVNRGRTGRCEIGQFTREKKSCGKQLKEKNVGSK